MQVSVLKVSKDLRQFSFLVDYNCFLSFTFVVSFLLEIQI
jgi:hypothetical protein